jgi:GntR family transcriptional regulator
MQIYGVARDTARKAVAVLRDQGYVNTVKGMGSFVRDREDWPSN